MYLIDWEYSGTNDPMFDIAALFLENDFSAEDEELFFHYYYGDRPQPAASREKILIFKIFAGLSVEYLDGPERIPWGQFRHLWTGSLYPCAEKY